jgi:rsbT co-antagonist protein RsbR
MWQHFLLWLDRTRLTDPLQRQQARIIQIMFLTLGSSALLTMPLLLVTPRAQLATVLSLAGLLIGIGCYALALTLIRRGSFNHGVILGLTGMTLVSTTFAVPSGVLQNGTAALSYAIPVLISGLLIGRRTMIGMIAFCLALFVTIALLEQPSVGLAGFARSSITEVGGAIMGFGVIISLIGIFISLFGSTFRKMMLAQEERSTELQNLQATLEQTVLDRTASLEDALREGERREARLEEALAELQTSRATIRELSAPVIPVLPGVLVMPLVGALDEQRADEFAQNLLDGVSRQRAHTVILDVTGVPLVDTHVARTLVQAANAIRLLGARTLLVGIRPEVAQTLVSLGVDLSDIPTYADLQGAIAIFIPIAGELRAAGPSSYYTPRERLTSEVR